MTPTMRMTTVASVIDLSPHMRRIIVTGDELADFPDDKKGAHIKALFPRPNAETKMPNLDLTSGFRQWMRSYTIREFDKHKRQLTLDFAVNDHQGLAGDWAANAAPGDHLGIAGPGNIRYPDKQARCHLLFGDITALPVIAATLETLADDARGHAWIQVPETSDIQQLNAPEHMEVHWLVTPNKLTNQFVTALASMPSDLQETSIFIALEASIVKQLKSYLTEYCQYDKTKLYAGAYWNQKKPSYKMQAEN